MSRLKNRINFSVMFVVGVGLTILGIYSYLRMNSFLNNSALANGTVVDLYVKRGGTIAPVVEFIDADGDKHTFTSKSSSSNPKYQLDQVVEVVYTYDISRSILEAYIYDEWDIFIRKYAIIVFGQMFVVLSIVAGRVFWNRDSMHVSYSISKHFHLNKRVKK